MIKLKNEYFVLGEKELILMGGKAGIGKTRFIVNEVNNAQRDNKVLFLSLEATEEQLIYDYKLQISNNLTIIDNRITIEELKKYFDKKYDYVYIDHLGLISNGDIKETLTLLKEYIEQYNFRIFMTDYIGINEKDNKYENGTYSLVTNIYILKEESIKKIK